MSEMARVRIRSLRSWLLAEAERRWSSPARDRGAILVISALVLAVLLIAAAATVDFGRLASTKRDLHTIADQASFDGLVGLATVPPPG